MTGSSCQSRGRRTRIRAPPPAIERTGTGEKVKVSRRYRASLARAVPRRRRSEEPAGRSAEIGAHNGLQPRGVVGGKDSKRERDDDECEQSRDQANGKARSIAECVN